MKRILLPLIVMLFTAIQLVAQVPDRGRPKFDPKAFEMKMEQYVSTAAGFTPAEASKFFPLYREMHRKLRGCFDEMRMYRHVDTNDDEASYKAIKRLDEIDLEMKELQQRYHAKLLKVVPAGKVMKVIKAEERFHRQAFKQVLKVQKLNRCKGISFISAMMAQLITGGKFNLMVFLCRRSFRKLFPNFFGRR